MIPELARMSVIIKSQHKTSVMTGNYELGYACGLMAKLSRTPLPNWQEPKELLERTLAALERYQAQDEREENVIHMLRYYHPDETCDEQVRELVDRGFAEAHVWQAIV